WACPHPLTPTPTPTRESSQVSSMLLNSVRRAVSLRGPLQPLKLQQWTGGLLSRDVAASYFSSRRQFCVGGNWKCNGSQEQVEKLTRALNKGCWSNDAQVVIAPPALFASQVRKNIRSDIELAAQDVGPHGTGA